MVPGEVFPAVGEIELNAGREALEAEVANTGDRPVQVGSHYRFAETNPALSFDRDAARGRRLHIPAGTAVRFEPERTRRVPLVPLAGARAVHGFRGEVEEGPLRCPRACPAPPTPACTARPRATACAWRTPTWSSGSGRTTRSTARR